jgi:hypothetical protein
MHSHYICYDSRIRTTSGSGIICILHFNGFFLWIRIRGSGSGFASHPTAFRKILMWYFLKEIRSAPPFSGFVHVFYSLALIKSAVRDLRIETRIRDRSPDPCVRPRTGTVERRGNSQQRTTDPASASRSAFRTVRYAAAFSFSLAHQKESCWVTGSKSSTRIWTFPDWSKSSGNRICRMRDAHDEGDSPGRWLPDRSPV